MVLAKPTRKQVIHDYFWITVGCLLTAIGLDLFLVPHQITAGGVSGIATIFYYLFHLPVGGSMLAMNTVLFAVGFFILGKEFGLRSLITAFLLSFMIDGLMYVPWVKHFADVQTAQFVKGQAGPYGPLFPLYATIFGDILTGVGMAIVFLRNSSTGGTDIPARILNKFSGVPIGRSLLFIDALVTIGAAFTFGVEKAMLAIIAIYINTKVIDVTIEGLNEGKQFLIVSEKYKSIADDILSEMDRGATILPAVGAYTGEERPMLLVVIKPRELPKLRTLIEQHDPKAFVMLSNVHEIQGEGFTHR